MHRCIVGRRGDLLSAFEFSRHAATSLKKFRCVSHDQLCLLRLVIVSAIEVAYLL
jgi:hypothetical protein